MPKQIPSLHSWSSALIAIVVGFGGIIALVVQVLRLLGASVEQTGSAVTALCLGIGLGGIALSLMTRMPIVLGAGMALAFLRRDVDALPAGATFGALLPTPPSFDARAIVSLALPLFLVTLVGQNLPGLVVLRTANYLPHPSTLIVSTGTLSLFAAPFGAHAVNLAAITAAICTSDDAHPDRAQRWKVGVIYGGMYLVLTVFSPALVRFFLALPEALIAVLTGLAPIPPLLGALQNMMTTSDERDAAILTFLATGSGLALFGLGSAF